jgi:hypothetical protein
VGGRQGGHAASVRILVALLLLLALPSAAAAEPLAEHQKLSGAVANGALGWDAANVGDLDGNGLDELVVGAPFGQGSTGTAYLFYAPVPAGATLADADAIFRGADVAYVGEALGAIGDLDDDGFDDLWLGAPGGVPGLQTTAPRPGVGYVLYGGPKRLRGTTTLNAACLPDPCDAAVTGTHASDFLSFGVTRTPLGDADGDGHADLLVGAAGFAGYNGAAHLVYGDGERLEGTHAIRDLAAATFVATSAGGFATKPMTGLGDLDGDGLDDVAISVTGTFVGPGGPAAVHVVHGSRTRRSGVLPLAAAAELTVLGVPSEQAGQGLAAGDLDADGRPDLVIGAPGTAGSQVRVLRGGPRRTGVVRLGELPGATDHDDNGRSVAIGELDGDPALEVAVGATDPGKASVIDAERLLAGGTLPQLASRVLTGEVSGDDTGFSVATGRFSSRSRPDDLVVGAPDGAAGAGAAYLVR